VRSWICINSEGGRRTVDGRRGCSWSGLKKASKGTRNSAAERIVVALFAAIIVCGGSVATGQARDGDAPKVANIYC
jgi:hypothetical protein